ncbi:MAG: hypothetical protein BMS9Abin26_0909 [Gammaproteobacteria bacterium]|nr:MAG: hypothetical protein BMS9Abin26_0909 [Gammaproteobacteria bacterium]
MGRRYNCRQAGLIILLSSLAIAPVLSASPAVPASSAAPATYECPGEYDKKIYTDKPCEGGQEIEIPANNTYKPEAVPPSRSRAVDAASRRPYRKFWITSPKANQVIKVANWRVKVSYKLRPGLQKGDYVVFKLDGKKRKAGKNSTLQKVYRGAHKLTASVRNSQGVILKKAKSVSFFVQSASDNAPPLVYQDSNNDGMDDVSGESIPPGAFVDSDNDGLDDSTGMSLPKNKLPRAPSVPRAPRAPRGY